MTEDDAWPPHVLAANHPPRQWNARSEATWEAIRQAYLDGVPARDLCDRYEVALSTLRLKAKEGGWRRADQPDSDLFPADADAWADAAAADVPDDEEESWADLADRARFRLRRAIASGRAAEAASWLRVYDRVTALAAAGNLEPPMAVRSAPDPGATATAVADQLASLARRTARATTEVELAAIDAEFTTLEACAAELSGGSGSRTLDSLDPTFSVAAEQVSGRGLSP